MEPHSTEVRESGMALLMKAMLPSTELGLLAVVVGVGLLVAVQVAVDVLHQGELFGEHGPLLFLVDVGLVDVDEQCALVGKDLRTVDAL